MNGVSDSANRQAGLVQQLVRRFMLQGRVPADEWAAREGTLLRFSESILNSSIKGSLEFDEAKLVESMKKLVASQDGGNLERAFQLSKALGKFQQDAPYRRKWAILQFLLRLTERGTASPSLNFSARPEPRPVSPGSPVVIEHEDVQQPSVSQSAFATFKQHRQGTLQREGVLLNDLLFVLHGHEGRWIRWDPKSQTFRVASELGAEVPLVALAEDLASIGSTVRSIGAVIASLRPECGVIAQGFKSGLQSELANWSKIVALFETHLSEGSMTLRRASVWFWTPRKQLGLLAELALASQNCSGATLLDRVATWRSHGCRVVRETVDRLLEVMIQPYRSALAQWALHGILSDPYGELFISKSSDSSRAFTRAFTLDSTRIPRSLIKEDLAEKILATGKTVHFLNLCQRQGDDLMMTDDAADNEDENRLFSDDSKLDLFHSSACARLGTLLLDRHGLLRHLGVLKDYLLFGRSDFCDALLEALGESLDRPAASLFRHNLVSGLDSAVRASACEELAEEIVRCLDVRLHEPSRPDQQVGWDVFSLDYRVPAPLDAVLLPETMKEYARLAQFLWLERRVHHSVRTSAETLKRKDVRNVPHDIAGDLKRLQMLHHEAFSALSAAVQFSGSACESAWTRLLVQVEKSQQSSDLDCYVRLVQSYLTDIRAALISSSSQALRPPALALLSACLRVVRTGQMFASYAHTLASNPACAAEAPMLKALTDLRAAINSAARLFQQEMDQFLTALQRELSSSENTPAAKVSATTLGLLYDFNSYHERRAGFDQTKYPIH